MQHEKDISELIFNITKSINDGKKEEADSLLKYILNNKNTLLSKGKNELQLVASTYIASGDFLKAIDVFSQYEDYLGIAFVNVILNKTNDAQKLIMEIKPSPFCNWCQFLISVSVGKKNNSLLSFLMIRNFLELTVHCLLMANNITLIQMLKKNINALDDVNSESEKYIGAAYFKYGDYEESERILKKALKRNKFDGEIHFFLGQIYLSKKQFSEALINLQNASLLMPDHYPAKKLINEAKLQIENNKNAL